MDKAYSEILIESESVGRVVKITRSFEESSLSGYVCGISESLVALHVINDDLFLNGVSVLRLEDIENVNIPDEREQDFFYIVLDSLGCQQKLESKIAVENIETVLHNLGITHQLITIFREVYDPDVCNVGKFENVENARVYIREVSTIGEWYSDITAYPTAEITRVDAGDQYAQGLARVALSSP